MLRKKLFIGTFALFVIGILASSSVHSSIRKNVIIDIRYSSNETFTRIVVECKDKISFKKNLLKFPDRLYFDLHNTLPASFHKKEISINDTGIKAVKIGQFNSTTTRIVLKLKSYQDYTVYTLESPHRLVVDINHRSKLEKFIPRKRIVVIDAGHGGKDPGALGRRGLREKDIALDVARRVKKVLETKYAVKVYLTRGTDRFLELKDRAAIANDKNADLFISIHANASRKRKTKGIETWFLNPSNNEEDQRVAARENAISLAKQKKAMPYEEQILASMWLQRKTEQSMRFAHYIQGSMIKNLRSLYKSRIKDLGVKNAFFYVLHTKMPSVLLEIGFITNAEEERLLRKASYRKQLSYSIARGVNRYLSTLSDMPKLARR